MSRRMTRPLLLALLLLEAHRQFVHSTQCKVIA